MILGIDLSTITLGYTVLTLDSKIIEMDYYSFKSKDLLDRAIELEIQLNILKEKFPEVTHYFIEERLKGFQSGGTNADALFNTTSINFLSQFLAKKLNWVVETINVNNARSLVFPTFHKVARALKGVKHKETIFKFVLRVLGEDSFKKYLRTISKGKRKGVVEYIEQAKDVSDSYVIARAGLIKLSNKQIK